eukprot:759832-Hanusia_phi.AAC.1
MKQFPLLLTLLLLILCLPSLRAQSDSSAEANRLRPSYRKEANEAARREGKRKKERRLKLLEGKGTRLSSEPNKAYMVDGTDLSMVQSRLDDGVWYENEELRTAAEDAPNLFYHPPIQNEEELAIWVSIAETQARNERRFRELNRRLVVAVRRNDLDTARKWIEEGASVNIPNSEGIPLVVIAAGSGRLLLVDDMYLELDRGEASPEMIDFLVAMGASVHARREGDAKNALMVACLRGDMDCIRTLLRHGADLADVEYRNMTVKARRRSLEEAETLPQVLDLLQERIVRINWRLSKRLDDQANLSDYDAVPTMAQEGWSRRNYTEQEQRLISELEMVQRVIDFLYEQAGEKSVQDEASQRSDTSRFKGRVKCKINSIILKAPCIADAHLPAQSVALSLQYELEELQAEDARQKLVHVDSSLASPLLVYQIAYNGSVAQPEEKKVLSDTRRRQEDYKLAIRSAGEEQDEGSLRMNAFMEGAGLFDLGISEDGRERHRIMDEIHRKAAR